jgi:alpha-ribazole phosphatase
MDLVLIRHPAIALPDGVCYGRSDVALARDPYAEAVELGARLDSLPLVRASSIVTSPLARCAEVARALAARTGVPLAEDARLTELDFGRWELRRWADIDRDAIDAWARDLDHACPHGGESLVAMAGRLREWLADVRGGGMDVRGRGADAATVVGRDGVVWTVSHAGPIRVLTALALGLAPAACLGWPLAMSGIVWLRSARSDPEGPREGEDAGHARAARAAWSLGCWNR